MKRAWPIWIFLFYFIFGMTAPQWTRASSYTRFVDHTQRRTRVGRTPLDEWSAHPRDLYLTHNTHDKRPCPRWDSNPQSQQASGRKPTPLTARPLGPVVWTYCPIFHLGRMNKPAISTSGNRSSTANKCPRFDHWYWKYMFGLSLLLESTHKKLNIMRT